MEEFCTVMAVHRGKILKKVLKEQGVTPTWLSRKRKVDRKTVYNWFDRKDLDLDVLISIGQDIHYDFSRNIPELSGVTMPMSRMYLMETNR